MDAPAVEDQPSHPRPATAAVEAPPIGGRGGFVAGGAPSPARASWAEEHLVVLLLSGLAITAIVAAMVLFVVYGGG